MDNIDELLIGLVINDLVDGVKLISDEEEINKMLDVLED